MTKDKRKFSRADFAVNGVFRTKAIEFAVKLINVSLKGALFEPPDDEKELKMGMEGHFVIFLSNSEISITAESRIVHIEGNHIGVRFTSIDIESITHLRNLLEYNLDNPEHIPEELAFLRDE